MSEIKVNGKIKVKTFQSEFLKKFAYLVPTLRTEEGKGIDNELTIAGARSKALDNYSSTSESELSVNGNLTVGGFEKRFKDAFGVDCEICYRMNGRLMRTNENHDKLTLSSLNTKLAELGAEKIVL